MAEEGLGISLFTSSGILLFLAILVTTLRCITRLFIVKNFGLNDWLMVLTVVLYTHYCAWIFYGRGLDQGRKDDEIPPDFIKMALMSFYFGECTYILTAMTLKLSIGSFLLCIVKQKYQVYSIYATLFVVSTFSIALFFMSVFQCIPVQRFWIPTTPGRCLPLQTTYGIAYAQSGMIGVSDFFFAFLPIFVIWDLKIDRFTKISVCGLMALGAVAGVTTIARIPYIKALGDSANFLHATVELAIVSSVEPGLGIIIGSAAATRPLFRSLINKYQTHSTPTNPTASLTTRTIRRSAFPPRRDIEMQVSSDEASAFEFNTAVVTTGGRRLCEGCREMRDPRLGKCGCGREEGEGQYSRHGSQEVLTPPNRTFDREERVIYKDVAVERVVEFLGKK